MKAAMYAVLIICGWWGFLLFMDHHQKRHVPGLSEWDRFCKWLENLLDK
jgi:hypothetical protein